MRLGRVSIEEAYRTWNMGNCFLVVTPEPDNAVRIAKKHGIKARLAGRVC